MYGRTDSVYNALYALWLTTEVALPLEAGDTINYTGAVWKNSVLYLTRNHGFGGVFSNIQDWTGTSDLYIGIKNVSASNASYGWIKVNCPTRDACYLKEYSFTASALGMKQLMQNKIGVYPNPAGNLLQIVEEGHAFQDSEIEIISNTGESIFTQLFSGKIDVSRLAPGLYTLKIIPVDKEPFYSKFIKE
ncbi:MAG: Secretion system C-terminal sorting domain [Bacteroidetes bacterium]|nr:Secretion system C-terminal sorting domain [Bacteroidota bacterium]